MVVTGFLIQIMLQAVRMRANFLQPSLAHTRLVDEDSVHSMAVAQMGNYQEYLKRMTPLLREIESQPVRQHMFGNPFKIDKVGFLQVNKLISIEVPILIRLTFAANDGRRSGLGPGGSGAQRWRGCGRQARGGGGSLRASEAQSRSPAAPHRRPPAFRASRLSIVSALVPRARAVPRG